VIYQPFSAWGLMRLRKWVSLYVGVRRYASLYLSYA